MFGSMEHGRFKTFDQTADPVVLKATGQGLLTGILVSQSSTWIISVFDGVDATGTLIVDNMTVAAATPYPMPCVVTKGIFIKTISGTGKGTCFYN